MRGWFTPSAHYRQASKADAVLIQEIKASGPAYNALQGKAAANQWKITATPAREGKRAGRSGGAAVLVRNCYSVEKSPGLQLQSEPHRATFAKSSVCGGVTLVSFYLHHGEGMSADNKRLLEEAAAEITQINGPDHRHRREHGAWRPGALWMAGHG